MRERRKEFAKKINEAYDSLIDEASKLRVNVAKIINKIEKSKKIEYEDQKFLKLERRINNGKELTESEISKIKEYL